MYESVFGTTMAGMSCLLQDLQDVQQDIDQQNMSYGDHQTYRALPVYKSAESSASFPGGQGDRVSGMGKAETAGYLLPI